MPRWVVANEDPDEEESSEEGTEAEEGSEEEEQEELEQEADEGPSKPLSDEIQEPAAKRQKISLQLGKQELRCHVGPITMLSPNPLPSSKTFLIRAALLSSTFHLSPFSYWSIGSFMCAEHDTFYD